MYCIFSDDRPRPRPRRSAAYFADLDAQEAPDRNILAKLGDGLVNDIADGYGFVFDVVLFVKTIFFVKLFHFSVDDFFDDGFRFARRQRLRLVNIAFLFEHFRSHFLAPHVARIERRDVHGDVMRKLVERICARHEVRLAIQLHEHADFSARVNIAAHQAFRCFAHGFLCGRGLSFLSQNGDGFFNVAFRFDERRAAVTESRTGPLAQFLNELRWDLHSWLLCTHPYFLFADWQFLIFGALSHKNGPHRIARP